MRIHPARFLGALVCACTLLSVLAPGVPAAQETPPTGEFVDPVARSRALYGESQTARAAGDLAGAVSLLSEAVALRPHHPTLLYVLAAAQVEAGDMDAAAQSLERLANMEAAVDLTSNPAFAEVLEDPRIVAAVARFEANAEPVGENTVVATLDAYPGIIPESVAYDSAADTWYVGSVRESIVLKVHDGEVESFLGPQAGLWCAFGMKVDPKNRVLWLCTTAAVNGRHVDAGDYGRTAVVRMDLQSGNLTRYEPPKSEDEYWFGDLAIHPSGDVYVTDSKRGEIWVLREGASALELFVKSPRFASLQGIAIPEKGDVLFVADYSYGVYRITPDGDIDLLDYPADATLLGIDGLYYRDNALIAIQNGTRPHKIASARLNDAQDAIVSVTTLTRNDPRWHEPTLGVLVGDDLVYMATSQWPLFDQEGNIAEDAELKPPVLMKVPLAQ